MPGCVGGGHGVTGKLYVTATSATGSFILRFDNARNATGNIAPGGSISGSATTLNNPGEISLDTGNNRLYVANTGASSIVIYDSISTATGNIAPTRTIAGGSTMLSVPIAVAADTSNDVLYVADSGNLLVFSPASTASGNIAPTRSMILGFTATALLCDPANNRLYVADGGGNSVGVYDNASTLNGAISASRTISGSNTLLGSPSSVLLDAGGRLVVSNSSSSSITIYNNAATASGNITPDANISGSNTTLVAPQQAALDTCCNEVLYVGDGGAGELVTFNGIVSANGNIAPAHNISGSNTGLNSIPGAVSRRGVALDTTR